MRYYKTDKTNNSCHCYTDGGDKRGCKKKNNTNLCCFYTECIRGAGTKADDIQVATEIKSHHSSQKYGYSNGENTTPAAGDKGSH